MISHNKFTPGIKAAISLVALSNWSYIGISHQFNVPKGTISSVMKLFIAFGDVQHRFTTKRPQIVTPKQVTLLVWLSKNLMR
jgi:hypothetical protein